ncbi:hypothetical protein U9M48_038379 [Paspalum notatum var. saurae]|uniref:CBF1-interacting co-repressor CIR N-terminal domain-containing protein n=1 Tax=Paspalum notatum var. saurae TaxID=547442 RepID=A0AAQ3UL83_PASNO
MALKFLNKKGWHTGSLRNIERVWKAEQAEEAEKRKTEELKKQVAAEKEKAEFRAMQVRAGLRPAQERLDFLYESGLAVGKSSEGFQALQQPAPGPAAASSSAAAQASAADSSKAATPGALFEDKPQSANDTWRKLHSDPLLLIRQREQDAIARIKNNPIKMAEIKKSVEAEKKQKEAKKEKKKHKKHRHHKSKSKRHHSDDDSDLDEKKYRRQESSDLDNDEPQRRRGDVSEDNKAKRTRHEDDEPRRRRHEDDEPRGRHQEEDEPRRRWHEDDEPRRRRQEDDGLMRRRQDDDEPRRRRQEDDEPRRRRHDDRLEADDRKRKQHSPVDYHHAYSKYDVPDSRSKRVEDSHKIGKSTSEQGSGEQRRQESEHVRNSGPSVNRRRGGVHHMSEEERLARLHQMQADAEVHEEQRWKRLKKAADDDAKEAATVNANQFKGKNFLEDEKKNIFGTDKGGSATIEESIRRRAFYSQGGRDAEGNAFRR